MSFTEYLNEGKNSFLDFYFGIPDVVKEKEKLTDDLKKEIIKNIKSLDKDIIKYCNVFIKQKLIVTIEFKNVQNNISSYELSNLPIVKDLLPKIKKILEDNNIEVKSGNITSTY